MEDYSNEEGNSTNIQSSGNTIDSTNVVFKQRRRSSQSPMEKYKETFDKFVTPKLIVVFFVWFSFQFIGAPLFLDIPIGSDQWAYLFTLSESNLYSIGLFTSMISHGSPFHLVINSIVFLSFGLVAETYLEPKKYITFLLTGGLIASLSQMIVVTQLVSGQFPPILGASGAISAVIGFVIYKKPRKHLYMFFIIPMQMWIGAILFIGGSLAVILIWGVGAGNLAHTAHIMGMVFGLVIGGLTTDTTRMPGVELK